jgi:hypothetical protein
MNEGKIKLSSLKQKSEVRNSPHLSLQKSIPDKRERQTYGRGCYVKTISRGVKIRWHCYIRTSLKNNDSLSQNRFPAFFVILGLTPVSITGQAPNLWFDRFTMTICHHPEPFGLYHPELVEGSGFPL